MKKGVSITDVARACGVSHSTVSRALSNHPGISAKTRERVKQTVRRLGYRPDAKLSQLMAQVRKGRQSGARANIGVVHLTGTAESEHRRKHILRYVEGVRERADALGYGVDEVFCEEDCPEGLKLVRMLRARNIEGVVLLSGGNSAINMRIDWSAAAWVAAGFFPEDPCLHAAAPDYVVHAMSCVDKLAERGCRRIGFACVKEVDVELSHAWLAGYSAGVVHRGLPLLLLSYDPSPAPETISDWVKAKRLDGVILHSTWVRKALEDVTPGVQLAGLNLGRPEAAKSSGIVERSHEVGIAAADLVIGQLMRGERGIPAFRKRTLVQGYWVDAARPTTRPGKRGR